MSSQASTEISASQKFARILYKSERHVRRVCFWIAIAVAAVVLLGSLLFPGNDAIGYLMIPILPFLGLVYGVHLLLVMATWPLLLSESVRRDPEISTTSFWNSLGRMHSLIFVVLIVGANLFF